MFPSSSSTSSADEGEAAATTPRLLTKVKSTTRREENLFSLKQFLKNDSQTINNFNGARPKIYEQQSKTPEPSKNHDIEKYPRNPTELPDFVQDHLIIEQCYFSDKTATNTQNIEAENLPDFTLNNVENRRVKHRNGNWHKVDEGSSDISFDLTDNLDTDSISCRSQPQCNDFSKIDAIDGEVTDVPETLEFPFDLQPPHESNLSANHSTNHSIQEEIHDTTKRLPDFLSDASIRTRRTPESHECFNGSDSMNQWLLMENERLRHELQIARIKENELTNRIQTLESELFSRRQLNHTENANNEKSMQQLKDNLKRSTERAVNAENRVVSLMKNIDFLSNKEVILRREITELKGKLKDLEAMKKGSSSSNTKVNLNLRIQKLVDDLRITASTAEVSLRQLVSGVNNLRVLASVVEKADKLEDGTKDFLPHVDEGSIESGTV